MTSPLSNYLKKVRPVVVLPTAEAALRGLKGQDGMPLLLPQLVEMIKEEMVKHETSETLHTFFHITVDDKILLIDNGKKVVTIMKALTRDEFKAFLVLHHEYLTAEAHH